MGLRMAACSLSKLELLGLLSQVQVLKGKVSNVGLKVFPLGEKFWVLSFLLVVARCAGSGVYIETVCLFPCGFLLVCHSA